MYLDVSTKLDCPLAWSNAMSYVTVKINHKQYKLPTSYLYLCQKKLTAMKSYKKTQ
jgi:hypothetical protein